MAITRTTSSPKSTAKMWNAFAVTSVPFEWLKTDPRCVSNASKLWNLDETSIVSEFGTRRMVFGPANTSHRGFRLSQISAGGGRHVTAIAVSSAAGDVLSPFFVFAGKYQMQSWFNPLPVEIFKDSTGEPHWLAKDDWFPDNGCIVGSKNRSMTKALIPILVDHINTNIRKIVPPEKKVCLVRDGHSSRKG